jgi:hypothetical protein
MGGEQGLSIRIGMGSALIGFLFFIDWCRVAQGFKLMAFLICLAVVHNPVDLVRFRWVFVSEGHDDIELQGSVFGGGGSIR